MSDWIIHIDGAARGNPGPAACAFVLERPGAPPVEAAERLGIATNNVAEYTALLHALRTARKLGGRRLAVFSDSELLVKQLNGEYRVKNSDLKKLFDEAEDLIEQFDHVAVRHVRREQNKRADALCNAALDGKLGAGPAPKPADDPRAERARAEAITCLRAAAIAWSRGNAADPPVEAVWEQLWSVLDDAGVLKKPPRR